MAQNMGLATDQLSTFGRMIERNGGNADSAMASLKGFTDQVARLRTFGEGADKFAQIGITGVEPGMNALQAYMKFAEYAGRHRNDPAAYRCLASAFAHLGRAAEAREAAARVLEVDPGFTISDPMSNHRPPRARAYHPPSKSYSHDFSDLLVRVGRVMKQERETSSHRDAIVFYAGNLGILENRAVSVVGSRDVTRDGKRRAAEVARDLAMAGVTIVSGLAKGVDTTALMSAISNGGRVAAVIGTSLDKAYPAENARLQRQIYSNHLLMTPFQVGRRALRSNLPVRNRIMTAITDATVIIEASDASGVLHQAAECVRLGRWLFITKTAAQDRALSWPTKFLGRPKVDVFSSAEDIMNTMAMGNT